MTSMVFHNIKTIHYYIDTVQDRYGTVVIPVQYVVLSTMKLLQIIFVIVSNYSALLLLLP